MSHRRCDRQSSMVTLTITAFEPKIRNIYITSVHFNWCTDHKHRLDFGRRISEHGKIATKSALPKQLQETAELLNKELLSTKKTFANLLPDGDLKNFMLNNIKTYMRKSFATFTNPEYTADPKIRSSAAKWILENVVKKNKDIRESALKELKTKNMTDNQALQEMAESLTNKILVHTKQDGVDPLRILQTIAKDTLRSDKLIRTGEELPDVIKKLLGEENNLKSSVLQTT